jgi:hypothetical protein
MPTNKRRASEPARLSACWSVRGSNASYIRRGKGRVVALERAGDCAGLVAAVQEAADAEVAAYAIKALEFVATTRGAAGKREVLAAGGIGALICALKRHGAAQSMDNTPASVSSASMDETQVADAALGVLAWITQEDEDGEEDGGKDNGNGECLSAADCVITIMWAHLDVVGVQKNGCRTLANLAAADLNDDQTVIGAAGGVQITFVAMGRHGYNSVVLEQALAALAALADHHAANQAAALAVVGRDGAAGGGIAGVVAAIEMHLCSAAVQREGCGALANLAGDIPETATAVAEAGGVDCIMAALYAYSDAADVQALACKALGRLAAGHPASQTAISDADGIRTVVEAMGAHRDAADVQEYGCMALGDLAADHPMNATGVRMEGGIEVVLAAMGAHTGAADVQREACMALAHLAAESPMSKDAIAAAGGVERAVAAMEAHADEDDMQQWGCQVSDARRSD